MTNASRRKGTTWESDLASYFNEHGTFLGEVFRAPDWGTLDKGDFVNTRDFVIEAKNVQKIDLAKFAKEVAAELLNAGRRWGAAIVKRRNYSTGMAYVVMSLYEWSDLVKYTHELEEELGRRPEVHGPVRPSH